jgi:hypothetical protein
MDKNEFVSIINTLVEKRVSQLVPVLVKNEIKKYMESGIKPSGDDYMKDQSLKNLIPTQSVPRNTVIRDSSIKEKKEWTKNSAINKILNETAQNSKPLPRDNDFGDYRAMMTGEYDNIEKEFTFNSKTLLNSGPSIPSAKGSTAVLKQQVAQVADELGAPPEIVNAMVKDYRGLLKKVDAKAKQNRNSGPIPGVGV